MALLPQLRTTTRGFREDRKHFLAARISWELEGKCVGGPWWDRECQARVAEVGDRRLAHEQSDQS